MYLQKSKIEFLLPLAHLQRMYFLALSLRSVMAWIVFPHKIGHGLNTWCPWMWPSLTMEPLQILSSKMKSLGQSPFSLTDGPTGRGETLDTEREDTLWWSGQRLEWCSHARGARRWQHCHRLRRSRKVCTQPQNEHDPADTWLLDFWPLEVWEDFCCFKSLSLWNFVTTALGT